MNTPNQALERVITHHWLRHYGQAVYHAYVSGKPGSISVCGEQSQITNLALMDIPGDRSKCCLQCVSDLYSYAPPKLSKDIK